ncbi:PREDICTED: uncharacterized protein LOC104604317 [Nelumbo nucifera]|uniref:DNL-type domain-containing protein n=2 Tax=Nelumbo nucifera TaxID=4432 RepID=A0A822ZT10_NELNU|nr:PREDICTED: uncharacterized protein LOC104604317 [Nelumbo nucifera]DAD46691.1 TPA_asm: hypothetical protein HUJ06_016628 [Nelumbo nucifera]
METLGSSATIMSSSSPLSIFSPKKKFLTKPLRFPIASKNKDGDAEQTNSNEMNIVPLLNNRMPLSPLSKDAAMGLVLSAAAGRGWTTGSGMEGPSVPAGAESESSTEKISTFPWSLFTKSPRRRMRVAFTCNVCGQRTTRAINPHAYTDGTVFVQCCGCNVFHKLVDNLNLFHEMKCYVNPSFSYRDPNGDVSFKYLDMDDDNDDVFPIL